MIDISKFALSDHGAVVLIPFMHFSGADPQFLRVGDWGIRVMRF